MGSVCILVEFVQHVEEVLHIADILGRGVVLATDPVSVGIGCQGRDIS